MLVLARSENEVICIGSNIRIVIVDVCGNRVRVGVEAPADVPIDRLEVMQAKQADGRCIPEIGVVNAPAGA